MNRTRIKLLIAAGVVLFVIVVLGAVLFPKVHYVDPKPAIASGEGYFSKLKQNQVDDAFAMYTEGFLRMRGGEWKKIVGDLDADGGQVTDAKLLGSQVVPVTLRDSTEIACIFTRYQVTLVSDERLVICPNQGRSEWSIAGHEITRVDNGEPFAAGITLRQKTLFSTS